MAVLKNKRQIRILKKAAKITVEIFDIVSKKVKVGAREKDIVAEIESEIRRRGLRRSFRTIVAGGPNAAKPHAKPTRRRLKSKEAVVIDFGVIYKGYHSDMTRTLLLGRVKPKMRLLYTTVLVAQRRVIKKVKAGVRISDVVRDANSYIRNKGLGKYILHSLGHGIGLKIHEAPKLSEKNKKILRKGMVCTIEPGLYIKGVGGVRIEDMVLIGKRWGEVLTR
ncbi:MAG: M24 family metallopeptidase [Candidatus Omnitrophica bacterium]|nr:M24 family metallopeptidase [Candidatus Omnitrophota bacterium]